MVDPTKLLTVMALPTASTLQVVVEAKLPAAKAVTCPEAVLVTEAEP